MRKLKDMTHDEIQAIPDSQWKVWNPFEKKSCDTCLHLKTALSHWCGNKDAIKARGTSLPGTWNCNYWYPDLTRIEPRHKTSWNLAAYKIDKPAPAKAPNDSPATKEENINKNKNKWAAIKQFKKKLFD